jgi:hypothetical protein
MEHMPATLFAMVFPTGEEEGRELFGAIQQIDGTLCLLIIYQEACRCF